MWVRVSCVWVWVSHCYFNRPRAMPRSFCFFVPVLFLRFFAVYYSAMICPRVIKSVALTISKSCCKCILAYTQRLLRPRSTAEQFRESCGGPVRRQRAGGGRASFLRIWPPTKSRTPSRGCQHSKTRLVARSWRVSVQMRASKCLRTRSPTYCLRYSVLRSVLMY